MTYEGAIEYLRGTLKYGSKLGLESIKYLLNLLGDPQKDLKVIHIAGTNGKGSTGAVINSILTEEGYRVGVFSSPYIEKINEMIRLNNYEIEDSDFAKVTERVKEKADSMVKEGREHPTEFEILTAMAFTYFKEKQVDFVLLEVGLGGRLDSTNVIESPLVSVFTSISLDHINILGNSLRDIAMEKAGIVKEDSIVVSYPQKREVFEVIERECRNKNSKLYIANTENIDIKFCDERGTSFDIDILGEKYTDLMIGLLGEHQVMNATLSLTVIKILIDYYNVKISLDSIYEGMKNVKWKGRLEIVDKNPTLLIDGAHNLEGARALRRAVEKIFKYKRLIIVIGILGDKDVDGILNEIIPLGDMVIITEPNNPRALSIEDLGGKISSFGKDFFATKSIKEAVAKSLLISEKDDLILFCGSLYLIGDIKKELSNIK